MHLNVMKFIQDFESEAAKNGLYRKKLGPGELSFLEMVWGPAFQYHFDGLRAEYPFKDFKGGQRFIDFVYVKNEVRLLIEIDGFTTHARDISPGEFNDHLRRQNDLILSGWLVLRFSVSQVEKQPQICQRQLKQAIGHWWSLTQGNLSVDDTDMWRLRKKLIIQMAMQRHGKIKPSEVAEYFHVSNRSAALWLRRFAQDGEFSLAPYQKRVRHYHLTNYEYS